MKQRLISILKSGAFKALICALVYRAFTLTASYLLYAGSNKLFDFWNIYAENTLSAPLWMKLPYLYSAQAISTVVSLAVCALLFKRRVRSRLKSIFLLSAAGFALGIVPQALFILLDSLRIDSASASSLNVLFYLIPIVASAAAEQLFFRRLLCFDLCKGGIWGIVISSAALVAFSIRSDALYMINLLLMHLLLIRITEQHGDTSAMLFKTMFTVSSALIIAPSASRYPSLTAFYPVSERLLTGGASGLGSSLALAIILFASLTAAVIRSFSRDGRAHRILRRSKAPAIHTRREA